jgi:hypothetical protein
MVIVGRRFAQNLGNIITDFVASVRKLIRRLVLVAAGGAATRVLFLGVGGLDKIFKIPLGVCVIQFDGHQLLFPIKHFVFVEVVAIVHLLQIKL